MEFRLRPRNHVTSALPFRARQFYCPNFALIRKGGCNGAVRLRVCARSAFRLAQFPRRGRTKLRLSRDFPGGPHLPRHPLNQSFERPRRSEADRKCVTRKFKICSRRREILRLPGRRILWEVMLSDEAKREAPVRTEPRPTRSFALPAPVRKREPRLNKF
jgi:hypothetical protein